MFWDKILSNRNVILAMAALFAAWLMFFDRNNIMGLRHVDAQISELLDEAEKVDDSIALVVLRLTTSNRYYIIHNVVVLWFEYTVGILYKLSNIWLLIQFHFKNKKSNLFKKSTAKIY